MWGFLASELSAVRVRVRVSVRVRSKPLVNPIPNPNQVRAALADCRESFAAAGWEAQCERVLRCNAAMCHQPYKP